MESEVERGAAWSRGTSVKLESFEIDGKDSVMTTMVLADQEQLVQGCKSVVAILLSCSSRVDVEVEVVFDASLGKSNR